VKDSRFSDDVRWREQHAELRRRGAALFAELGDAAALLSGVGRMLRGEGAAADALPPELASAVQAFVERREVRALGALFAIGRSLALEALSWDPSAERVQRARERLHRSPSWVLETFEVEVLALLAEREPGLREAWLTAFETEPPLPTPAAGPPAAVEVFHPQGRWTIESPFELWNDPGADAPILLVSAYAPGILLREADPDRWFRAVDRWNDGRLVDGALFGGHVLHDADALLHWLAIASPVFDSAGVWTGRTAAAVLTLRVLKHAEALVGATLHKPSASLDDESALRDLRDRELPALFQRAWSVMLARSDGLALATALHTRLSAPNNWPRVWRVEYPAIARTCLEQALAAARPPARQLRMLQGARQHSDGQPARGAHASALTALSAAVVIAQNEPTNEVELFEWFVELLASPPADWDAFAHQQALDGLLARLSCRVARIDDIVERCDAVYRSLDFGRHCGEFARGRGLNDGQRASVVLLGLALHVLLQRGGDAPGTRRALDRVFERALRLALVSQPLSVAGAVSPRALLTSVVAATAKLDPESLRRRLAPLTSDPGHAAECVTVLLKVVPEEELKKVLGGVTLQDFAASVEAWACATDHPDDRTAAANLAAALEGKPDEGPL
jgi:hypothetical protein